MIGFGSWLETEAASLLTGRLGDFTGQRSAGQTDAVKGLRMGADLGEIKASLRRRVDRNELYFRIAFALSVALAATSLIAPFLPIFHGKPSVSTLFGITATAAIAGTVALYKEKNTFDIMIELAVGLGEDEMRKVLEVLIRRQAKGKQAV